MREADVALRLREPSQPDLIRRRLFAVHYHLYASSDYLRRHGQPQALEDLTNHRLMAYSAPSGIFFDELNAPLFAGRDSERRVAAMSMNHIPALQRAVENGIGIGVLPDYLNKPGSGLVQLMTDAITPTLNCYLVYPESVKNVSRVRVFRDFLVANAAKVAVLTTVRSASGWSRTILRLIAVRGAAARLFPIVLTADAQLRLDPAAHLDPTDLI